VRLYSLFIFIWFKFDLKKKEKLVEKECELFSEFERSFPSVCFSIATGIGKTRLMGAFVAYLFLTEGIKKTYDWFKDNYNNARLSVNISSR
jgi:hypothetical protein